MRSLAAKGIDPGEYAGTPVDRQAVADSLVRMRRAVASPLPKDAPQVLSRGAGLGDNVSVARSVFQFGNIFLDQWSNIRHDFWQAGIKAGDPAQAAKIAAAVGVGLLIETGIVEGSHNLTNAVTGHVDKKDDGFEKRLLADGAKRFPFVSQGMQIALYRQTGIPLIDTVVSAGSSALRPR